MAVVGRLLSILEDIGDGRDLWGGRCTEGEDQQRNIMLLCFQNLSGGTVDNKQHDDINLPRPSKRGIAKLICPSSTWLTDVVAR
jgi:hypothetical protein